MQRTYQLNSENLNSTFIESVRELFIDREIKIVVEDVEEEIHLSQKELYVKSLALKNRFKNLKLDANMDLSALANEVNL